MHMQSPTSRSAASSTPSGTYRLQPGSTLINVARGAIVDTGALIHALRTRHLSVRKVSTKPIAGAPSATTPAASFAAIQQGTSPTMMMNSRASSDSLPAPASSHGRPPTKASGGSTTYSKCGPEKTQPFRTPRGHTSRSSLRRWTAKTSAGPGTRSRESTAIRSLATMAAGPTLGSPTRHPMGVTKASHELLWQQLRRRPSR